MLGSACNEAEQEHQEHEQETLTRYIERQALLLEVSRLLLGSAESRTALIEMVFARIREHLNADICFYYERDEVVGDLRLIAGIGVPDGILPRIQRLSLGQALCGVVAQTGVPVIADRERLEALGESGELARSVGARSYASHPLYAGDGRPLGTFAVASTRRADGFTREEADFLQTLCHLIAMAMERTQAEAALRRQKRFLREVIDTVPSIVFVKDAEGRFTLANRALAEAYNTTVEGIEGRRDEDFTPDLQLVADYRAADQQTLESFGQIFIAEEPLLQADGEVRWLQTVKCPIRSPNRDGYQVLGVGADITERIRTEVALRESEQRLETVVDNLNEGLILSDSEGDLLHWNRAALRMHGFADMKECLRALPEFREIYELFTLDGQELSFEEWPMLRLLRGERLEDVELRVRRKDIVWDRVFRYGGATARDTAGRTVVFLTISDITERNRTERELRESESRFRQLTERLPQLVWTCTPEGVCDYLSPQWCAYTGLPAVRSLGFDWLEQVHPEDREATVAAWNRAVDTGADFGVEFRIRRHDGVYRWFDTRGVRLTDASGATVKWFGTNTDIEDRKQAEESLRQEKERLHLALEAGRMGTWQWNPATQTGKMDENACYLFGLTPESFEKNQEPALAAIHPDDRDLTRATLHAAVLVNATFKHDFRVIHPDESVHWLHSIGRGLYSAEGEFLAFNGVTFEITERKKSEAVLRELNATLEQRVEKRTAELATANQELEAFAYSVSHDLRAPLRGIDGFSQALLEDYSDRLDETGRDYLRRVRTASQRMGELIDDILALARVGRIDMRREIVDLSAIAQEVAHVLEQAHPKRARQVKWSITPNLYGEGDGRLLRIVLENLLGNAWKYTSRHEHAHIEFGVHPPRSSPDGKQVFFVRDDGAGFDMAYADKLFGAFQRLHTETEFEGNGIGLATVQRIIHRHGGRVWAESAPGEGAKFSFTLEK